MKKTTKETKCGLHAALIAELQNLSAFAELNKTLPGVSFTFEIEEDGQKYKLYHKNFNNRLPCLLGYSQQEIELMADDFLTTVVFEKDRGFIGQMFLCLRTGQSDAVFNTIIRLVPPTGNKVHMMLQCLVSLRYADGRPKQIKGNGWVIEDDTYLHQQMYCCLKEDLTSEVLAMINELSNREIEVLKCQLKGLSAKETAGKLIMSVHTVNSYTKTIREIFNITNKESLMSFAIKNNLIMWLKAEQ
jgi:DNA-binding CsgD family transcriptional regulator